MKLYAKLQKEQQQNMERRYNQGRSQPYGGSRTQPVMSNPSSTSNPPKKVVHFVKGPSSATLVQMRSCTCGATQAGTQPKTVVQQQMKPIIKTDPDT